jgi:hypothetical protein
VFDDGACRVINPRPDPKPPIVNNDPCAKLSGAEFRRCIAGTPNMPVDPKPPIKLPVTGGGDVRPGGKPAGNPGIGSTGSGSTGHNPVGGTGGTVNPVKPNVILRPQFDGPKNIIRDNGPSNKLPTTSVTTLPKQSVTQPQRHTFIR